MPHSKLPPPQRNYLSLPPVRAPRTKRNSFFKKLSKLSEPLRTQRGIAEKTPICDIPFAETHSSLKSHSINTTKSSLNNAP